MTAFPPRALAVLIVLALAAGVAAALPRGSSAAAQLALERYVIVPAESTLTYRVGEVFLGENNRFNLAVGTTTGLQGEVHVNRANPAESRVGKITVDISRLTSDSARRDNAIRARWLESGRFPGAEFTPTAIRGLPSRYRDGEDVQVTIFGNLKIRDVTRETPFAAKLNLDGPRLTGDATTTIKMTDFGFQPPAILGMLRSENEAKIEIRFLALRAP
jgi:polyisoprenoid-binding protein YceI